MAMSECECQLLSLPLSLVICLTLAGPVPDNQVRVAIVRQYSFERLIVIAVVEVIGVGQWQIPLRTGITRIVNPDLPQFLRCFDTFRWAEQQSIDKAEYRRVQADRKSVV